MVVEKEIQRRIRDGLKSTGYSSHVTNHAWKYTWMNGMRLVVSKNLDLKQGDKVLDVGCGDGWFSVQNALKYTLVTFVGLDLYEADEAEEIAKLLGIKNCTFLCKDALEMKFDEKFDHAVLFMSMGNICERISDIEKLLKNCWDTIKIESKLLIVEPFEEDFPIEIRGELISLYKHYKEKGLPRGEDKETILNKRITLNILKNIGYDIDSIESKSLKWCMNREEVKNYFGFKELPFKISEKFWVLDYPNQLSIIVAKKR